MEISVPLKTTVMETVKFSPAAAEPVTAKDIDRFPRWLTTFSSEGKFKFPLALVIEAS